MRRITLALLLVVVLALPLTALADSPTTHTVAWGETLYSIARQFGVTPQALADANRLTTDSWVYAGQVLQIPGSSSSAPANPPQTTPSGMYTVRAGDTLTSVAARFGLSADALADANGLPRNGMLYTGTVIKIPGKTGSAPSGNAGKSSSSYIVQRGDTLFGIAVKFGVSTQAIVIANNLPGTMVYTGQRLVIPNGGGQVDAPQPTRGGSLNVRVSGIPVYRQSQTLTCEETAAAMAVRGALSEAQIVRAMPRSDNPFLGIRGSTNYPIYGGLTNYGTYAQGLARGLSNLGRRSTVLYGQSFSAFKASVLDHLRAGRAVIWWTTWRQTYQSPTWTRTANGTSIKLVPYEHAVVIMAATDAGITYADPYDGTIRSTSWADFQRVSAYFDNMALVVL